MTPEQAIEAGYQKMIAHMTEQRDQYLVNLQECPEDFDRLDEEDVFIWLMESF